jgi:predicted permease
MQQLTSLFSELIVLYLIAAVGYLAKRTGAFDRQADHTLTRLVLYITLPALILYSLNSPFSFSLAKNLVILIFLSAYALGAATLKAHFYLKENALPSPRQGIQQGLIIFGNQGFLGFAVCQALFAKEGIMYAAIFNILYLTLIWTYGIYIIARNTTSFRWKMIVLNPGTVATLLGLLIFFLPWDLPNFFNKLLLSLGSPTPPLSMLLIGSFMADLATQKVWEIAKDKHLWQAVFIKLVLLPLLIIPFAFFGIDYKVLAIGVLLTAMPSAPTISLYAKKYGGDVSYASLGVFISTLLLPVTLPVLYWLLNMIYSLM